MTEFTVTGIRFQMGDHLSFEQKNEAAIAFVNSLQTGQQVMLAFEPDNPASPNKAIAVYIDFRRIGYITDEECTMVYPLLDEWHHGKGTITRTDGHVTFFITMPGAHEHTAVAPAKRVLPESPLGNSFRMPFTKEENILQLIAPMLQEIKVNKDNIAEFIMLAQRFIPLARISICHEDKLLRRLTLNKLVNALNDQNELDMSDSERTEMEMLCDTLRDIAGDMHRTTDHYAEKTFVQHLDTLRNDASASGHLYKKYQETFLDGKSFDEAGKDKLQAEYDRLSSWLQGMIWSELRHPRKLMEMGFRVNYLGLSRWELYDLYSVILLIEKLADSLNRHQPLVDDLLPEMLKTPEAMKYWARLQKAGFVDERYRLMPDISRKQAMYIADVFSEKLELKVKWKPFQDLWAKKNLAQEKWDFQQNGMLPARSAEIDSIFKD